MKPLNSYADVGPPTERQPYLDTCPTCEGTGTRWKDGQPCTRCEQTGQIETDPPSREDFAEEDGDQ